MRNPATLIVLLAIGTSLLSCASRTAQHPLERTKLWHRYVDLADVRALAIAGDPGAVWVGGAASGLPGVSEAKREALAECERRRAHRRIQAPCVIYAVGSEVAR